MFCVYASMNESLPGINYCFQFMFSDDANCPSCMLLNKKIMLRKSDTYIVTGHNVSGANIPAGGTPREFFGTLFFFTIFGVCTVYLSIG